MGKRDLRIYALLDTLKESPVLSIKELADRFQVSEMTIRRDIDYLKETMYRIAPCQRAGYGRNRIRRETHGTVFS